MGSGRLLNLVSVPRARALLRTLNQGYTRFVNSLPPDLAALARRRGTYVGAAGGEKIRRLEDLNPLISCSPWLFWEAFEGVDDHTFASIALAGACLSLSSGVMDKLVDGEAYPLPSFLLLHEGLTQCARRGFGDVLGSRPSFWREFDRLGEEYWRSLAAEVSSRESPSTLTLDSFVQFSGGKVSPIVVSIAAFAEVADSRDLLPPIEQSFRMTFAAGQLHDDILDWHSDATTGHVTYFLARLFPEGEWAGVSDRPLAAESHLEQEWTDVELFGEALELYDRALAAVRGLHYPSWEAYLKAYRGRAEEDRKMAMARHLQRITARPPSVD